MTILQLLNIFLFWLLLGTLTSHLAKKRGRHPLLWFFLGMFLGIFALLLLFVISSRRTQSIQSKPIEIYKPKNDLWLQHWYFLDQTHAQKGPIEFIDLAKFWRDKQITEESFLWSSGMKDWKRLSELPDVKQEIEQEAL